MRHQLPKAYQLLIAIQGYVSPLSNKLKDLEIQNFEELYRFSVQKEADLAHEKKFFGGITRGKDRARASTSVQINAIGQPRNSLTWADLFLKS